MGNDLLLLLLLLASLSYLILINILISKCFALFRSPVEKKKGKFACNVHSQFSTTDRCTELKPVLDPSAGKEPIHCGFASV